MVCFGLPNFNLIIGRVKRKHGLTLVNQYERFPIHLGAHDLHSSSMVKMTNETLFSLNTV